MKKVLAMLLAVVMVFALCACGSSSSTTTAAAPAAESTEAASTEATTEAAAESTDKVGATVLKVAFNQSATNPECATLEKISDDLYDATEGRYSLEVYPDASLGDQAQTLELVTSGALDMTLVGNAVVESYVSDFAIIGTPYVYDDEEHCERVFESDALDTLLAETQEHGFTVLSVYSLGARNLYTKEPVTNPEELAGKKIRVMGSDTCVQMMNDMGGTGITMAQGDVYSAIQTGTIDGAENNIITYVDLVQYEVAPYYNYSYHLMVPDHLCINNNVLAAMGDDAAILEQLCKESMPYAYDLIQSLHAEYQAKAEAQGVTFSETDVSAFQELCAGLINDVASRNEVTQAVYDSIVALRE